MAKDYWDPRDPSTHWIIEQQLKAMINGGQVRYYDRIYKGSVEDVVVHTDGTAEVDLFGYDQYDDKGHFHFHLNLHSDGSFDVKNCHKK